MNSISETPHLEDQYGDAHVNGFGFAEEFQQIDADAFPIEQAPSEAELDALFVAEMEKRDAAESDALVDLLRRSIQIENAKRQQSSLAMRIALHNVRAVSMVTKLFEQ